MTVTELIDQIIGRTDNVGVTDADYTNRRTRHLEYLIEEFEWLWTAREWSFRRAANQITISAGDGGASLPSDFQNIGRRGRIWVLATGQTLDWIPEDALLDINNQPGFSTSDPRFYTISYYDTDFNRTINVETNTNQLILGVAYNKKPPTIDDDSSSAADNLKAIPEEYHQSVLVPAVRSMASFSKGDQSWEAHEQKRQRGLNHMIRAERQPQDTLGQFPSFFGGRMY